MEENVSKDMGQTTSHTHFYSIKQTGWQEKKKLKEKKSTVIVPALSDALPLSVSHNKSPVDRLGQYIYVAQEGSSVATAHKIVLLKAATSTLYLLVPPSMSVLILEMFSVANNSIMLSYTCNICK